MFSHAAFESLSSTTSIAVAPITSSRIWRGKVSGTPDRMVGAGDARSSQAVRPQAPLNSAMIAVWLLVIE
jgi:hypothetical protein